MWQSGLPRPTRRKAIRMRTYAIEKSRVPLPTLTGGVFNPDDELFCAGECAAIDVWPWGGDYRPEARAYLSWDDAGLNALLCANEPTVSRAVTSFGGDVWTDSCLEFFFRPFADDPRYVNIEVNAAGAALIAIGEGREGRRKLEACPPGMEFRASEHAGGWWAVAYAVPFALIAELYGRAFRPGQDMLGNFYCCDETLHAHFGCWNPIDAPAPDFHRPECFGKLVFQA